MKELTPDEILAAIRRAMEETWRRVDQAKREEKSANRESDRLHDSAPETSQAPVARGP